MGNVSLTRFLELAAGLIILGLIVVGGYFALQKYKVITPSPAPSSGEGTQADLGTQLYEQSKNPIQNKLPDSVTTVPNPVQNIYKNPFQW